MSSNYFDRIDSTPYSDTGTGLALADKILVMEQGRLKLFGPRDAVLEHLSSQHVHPKVARRHIHPRPAHAGSAA